MLNLRKKLVDFEPTNTSETNLLLGVLPKSKFKAPVAGSLQDLSRLDVTELEDYDSIVEVIQ